MGPEEIRRGQSMETKRCRPEDGNCLYCRGYCCSDHPEEASFPRRKLEERWALFNNGIGSRCGKFTGARDEWDHGNCEEEASQQERHGIQNGEGFPFVLGWGVVSTPVDPGDEVTKKILTDEARRPSKPRSEMGSRHRRFGTESDIQTST